MDESNCEKDGDFDDVTLLKIANLDCVKSLHDYTNSLPAQNLHRYFIQPDRTQYLIKLYIVPPCSNGANRCALRTLQVRI